MPKFDDWLKEQPEETQTLIGDHVKGLKSALESERDERKKLNDQLGELKKSVEKGSEAEQKLGEMQTKLASADRKIKFFESAGKNGVKNAKAAFVLAEADGLIKDDSIDFESLKKSYPEMFAEQEQPKGDAGDGTTNPPGDGKASMDNWIRRIN